MGLRDDLQKRIDKKRAEITSLKIEFEAQLREATSYLQALEDTMKLLPRDPVVMGQPVDIEAQSLRVGTNLAKARQSILDAGRPLHIQKLLEAIGKPPTAANRAALCGSIGAYVRKGQIFTRPAPNTFGVVEFNGKAPPGPPPNFGLDEEVEMEDTTETSDNVEVSQ